jgi:hypothetical protein
MFMLEYILKHKIQYHQLLILLKQAAMVVMELLYLSQDNQFIGLEVVVVVVLEV